MNRHKKSLRQLLALGILAGLLLMGFDLNPEKHVAPVMSPDGPAEKAPVLSDRNLDDLRHATRRERILM